MKKTISILLILVFVLFGLYAGQYNAYVTAAYNYGIFTERGDLSLNGSTYNATKSKAKVKANGIDLSASTYFQNNFGYYLNTGYYFPYKMELSVNGVEYVVKKSQWNKSIILSAILGPSYRYRINDKLEICGAVGFHYALTAFDASSFSMLNSSIGIGGDIEMKYLPTSHFYITLGSLFSHDFYAWSKINTYYGESKSNGTYNYGGFRPYIGVGFTYSGLVE